MVANSFQHVLQCFQKKFVYWALAQQNKHLRFKTNCHKLKCVYLCVSLLKNSFLLYVFTSKLGSTGSNPQRKKIHPEIEPPLTRISEMIFNMAIYSQYLVTFKIISILHLKLNSMYSSFQK